MYFPLFLDLSDKNILVAGAGRIACRRVRALCGFAGHITVVAPRICGDLSSIGALSRADSEGDSADLYWDGTSLMFFRRRFRETDLEGMDMVLAATDDAAQNGRIADLCHERGIPVNVCSDAQSCDFQFPSVVETKGIVIGMNASGVDHRLVKETRKQVETLFEDADFHSRYGS
ncbi:MAG: bifunctional precorrin-2 dehydrogenase/sirohydrochlorin ferrochelatase [Lachnospiraceae bacterium]|nr:bifunctional precorrin-2 dehydrogenase/sirohydrochlorin ferrochelatase [Lachnospiraceae bacterium]